jgi:serine protein kinase
LFHPAQGWRRCSQDDYGIAPRYISTIMSPWAVKRLREFGGDITRFRVVRLNPSVLSQVAVAKTEPGDENNQDISSLVGKIDIRKLETYSQDDPDAYSYSGGLCLANRGVLEFVEMFKAPIKVLHPLADGDAGRQLQGDRGFRRHPVRRPGTGALQRSRMADVQEQPQQRGIPGPDLHRQGALTRCAFRTRSTSTRSCWPIRRCPRRPARPTRLRMLAQFSVLSRLKEPENSSIFSKMRVYDGENLKDTDSKAKSYQEYRDFAGVDEGMTGLSTRFAFKILSRVFNFDHREVAANPVHLMYVLEQQIEQEQFPPEIEEKYLRYDQGIPVAAVCRIHRQGDPDRLPRELFRIRPEHLRPLRDLRRLLDPGPGIPRCEYRGDARPRRTQRRAREDGKAGRHLESEGLPQRSRQLRAAGAGRENSGRNPSWTSYEKLRTVIEKKMFSNTEDLLPVISFNAKASADDQKKHQDFVDRMISQGLYREAGPAAVRMVSAGAQVFLMTESAHGTP